MNDLISRSALLEEIHNAGGTGAPPESWADGWDKGITEAYTLTENAPAVDAVEVVRCKDCNYGKWWQNMFGIKGFKCELFCADINPNGFCSYGERKENG